MMHRNALVAMLVGSISVACDGGEGGDGWATTVDTLETGAVHVVNTPSTDVPAPTWRLEEDLRIGSVEGDGPDVFGLIKGIAVLSDDRVAVLDAQAQQLRVFGAGGGHFATYGRRGGGPGEMEEGYGLMVGPGDSLWVPDNRNARMSVFHPDEGFSRSSPMPFLRYGYVWSGIMTAHGRVWKPSSTLTEPRRGIIRVYGRAEAGVAHELRGIALEPGFALLDSLPLPPGPDVDPEDPPSSFFWQAPGGLPRGYISVPFFARSQLLLDPRGVAWSTAFGDPSYRIVRWVPGGDTTLVLETRRAPVPVTAAERDSVIESVAESLEERGVGVRQDWSKIPEVKPAVLSMLVDEAGRLWVETSSPDSLTRYDVYERDGRWAGTAVTALDVWRYVTPVVRGDLMWAVVTDELDVPYVVRARLVPVDGD